MSQLVNLYLLYVCISVQAITDSSNWEHKIKVKKNKDLLGCTERQDIQTMFQGAHYDSTSVSIMSIVSFYGGPVKPTMDG